MSIERDEKRDELDLLFAEAQRRQEIPWELTAPDNLAESIAAARQRRAEGIIPDLQPIDISPFWPEGKKELCRRINNGRKRVQEMENNNGR